MRFNAKPWGRKMRFRSSEASRLSGATIATKTEGGVWSSCFDSGTKRCRRQISTGMRVSIRFAISVLPKELTSGSRNSTPYSILSSNSCCFLYCLSNSGVSCCPVIDSSTSVKGLPDLRLSISACLICSVLT